MSDVALERPNLNLAKPAPGKGDSTETCVSSHPSMGALLQEPVCMDTSTNQHATMPIAHYSLAQYLGILALLAMIKLLFRVPALIQCLWDSHHTLHEPSL